MKLKKSLFAAAALAALVGPAAADVCTLGAKDGSCIFTTDTSGGTVIYSNPTNLDKIGSGEITPFLSTQQNGTESGVTTDSPLVSTLPLNDKRDNSKTFTQTFTQQQLAVVTLFGKDYYQFFLDANEPNSDADKLISIDTIRIWDAKSAAQQILDNTNVSQLSDVDNLFSSLIYAMGFNNDIILDANLFAGSGLGYDMSMLVPVELFAGVALDSRIIFGVGYGQAGGSATTADGFEEWAAAAGTGPTQEVPEPSGLALAGFSLLAMGAVAKRSKK